MEHDIETTEQLKIFKENAELKISELVIQRNRLYSKNDLTAEIRTINAELRKLRKNIRMCNNIFQDIETIREHQKMVELFEREASKHSNRKLYHNDKRYFALIAQKAIGAFGFIVENINVA